MCQPLACGSHPLSDTTWKQRRTGPQKRVKGELNFGASRRHRLLLNENRTYALEKLPCQPEAGGMFCVLNDWSRPPPGRVSLETLVSLPISDMLFADVDAL